MKETLSQVGLGLRAEYISAVLETRPAVPWFEVISDNYLERDACPQQALRELAKHYPITLHGVGMSLGSAEPLDLAYLKNLKRLIKEFKPLMVSDHLAWCSIHDLNFHDLLPLPYNKETARFVASKIKEAQRVLGVQLLIENVSCYLNFKDSNLSEWQFVNLVAEMADCYILLDLNNIYVNSVNFGYNAKDYLDQINHSRVKQLHLGGHEQADGYLLDSHANKVSEPVWGLYRYFLKRYGPLATLLEWDNNLPDFSTWLKERELAQREFDQYAKSSKIAAAI